MCTVASNATHACAETELASELASRSPWSDEASFAPEDGVALVKDHNGNSDVAKLLSRDLCFPMRTDIAV